jgi:hypothetical protein
MEYHDTEWGALMTRWSPLAAVLLLVAPAVVLAQPRAAVLDDRLPEADPVTAKVLADAVRQAGYDVRTISTDVLSNPAALAALHAELLILPSARSAPRRTIPAVRQHLESGGHLIACGLPAWDLPVVRVGQRWVTKAEALQGAARTLRLLASFEENGLDVWRRSSNVDRPASALDAVDTSQGKAMHVIVPALSGWDTYGREFAGAFAKGHSLTCFRAKGGPNTRRLIAEWQETDGSRWIATIDVTPEWQQYTLPPEAFLAWEPSSRRGGPKDRLDVCHARRFTIGVAISHIPDADGRQEYWFDDLGTAPCPWEAEATGENIPHIESLSPPYQFFPITTPAAVFRPQSPDPDSRMLIAAPPQLTGIHPRPSVAGHAKERPWIRQVLLYAHQDGDYRGAIATLTIPTRKAQPEGAIVALTPREPAFYRQRAIASLITDVARRLRRGIFLQEGGAACYTALENQVIPVGAKVRRLRSAAATSATVRVYIVPASGTAVVYDRAWPLGLSHLAEVSDTFQAKTIPNNGFRVVTELYQDQQIVERCEHELHIWKPKERPEFVRIDGGQFVLDGRRWKPHGVNYMPSSGVGLADSGMFEFWLSAAAYDPEIIERDLRRIKAMRLNALSVFLYQRDLAAQNLLDLLRRSASHGLKVNLSLRPGTPLDFHGDEVRQMIQALRLAENDTVFAYDLAWEPSHYGYDHQKRYAPCWARWVTAKYGTVEAAERDWDWAAPRANGDLDVPPSKMLIQDGSWRKMVADYRQFLDEYLAEPYAAARRLVQSIDRKHAVSFRMQHAGDPTINNPGLLPYDFWGLRQAVDIWEPEAYGRIGDWDRIKPGHFTAAYARLCDPTKPVMWSEMGVSVWDPRTQGPSADRLVFVAQYYRDFYRMLTESDADGVFFWWYPGGYRVNEKSDFGILNPDGTDRPVTKVIREEGLRFLAAQREQRETVTFEIDRDADARGLFGSYETLQEPYWSAVNEGKWPALKWKREPGSR